MTAPDNALANLQCRDTAQESLHRAAGEQRDVVFGRKIFVRGVVEVSNYCRENCSYCGMRRDNRNLHRYRMERDALLELVLNQRPASITDINFQTGEDPVAVREIIIPVIREIRRTTHLGISVCLGTLPDNLYRELHEAGADFYIIKLETGNEAHYRQMASPGNLAERLTAIRHLAATGWNVSSGFILGLPGQDDAMILQTLELLGTLPLAGCSVSPFIPGNDTLLSSQPTGSLESALNCLAMMRLAHPQWIIPAVSAMTLLGEGGYARAIQAGANLATINLTPSAVRDDYLLYTRGRNIMTEERILREIENAGCKPSTEGICTALANKLHCAAA